MIRRCPACGRPNRIPPRHLAERGRCGSCKAPLPPVSEPIDADEATFHEVVREASVPVLVDVVLKDGHVVLQRAGLVDAAQLGRWLAAA